MKKSNQDKRNIIIIGLCIIVLLMAVGYAAFASRLTINGTSEVTSNWDVKITDVTPDKLATKTGNTYTTTGSVTHTPNETNGDDPSLSATFSAVLVSPGDEVTYDVTIKNLGSLKAKLDRINENLAAGSSEYIEYEITGAKAGKTVLAPKNDESGLDVTHLYVKVKYKDISEGQGQPDVTTWGLTITLDFSQTADEPSSGTLSPAEETIAKLKQTVTTTGDGIYEDDTEQGKYIFKGSSPKNYLTFNGETAGWRIVSIENDGTIKIVRNTNLTTMSWDASNTRNKNTSTYCVNASSSGCNAWAATENLVGHPSEFTLYAPNGNQTSDTITYSGTVTKDASLNTFLNGEYYNNPSSNSQYLGSDKKYIESHNFYVGTPGDYNDEETIAVDVSQEKQYTWNGKIGLISATDYMKASTDSGCTSLKTGNDMSSSCGNGNYLKPGSIVWTISPYVSTDRTYEYTYAFFPDGGIRGNMTYGSNGIRPSFFLSNTIKLKGEGTSANPYYIES